ncbi:MAG: hypothetical protein WBV69_05420 [Candidatus Sulfotelmatobacter sp.]
MSDPRDRNVFGGASLPGSVQGPLYADNLRPSSSHGFMGQPRGTIVVAQAAKPKKAAEPQDAPKVAAREISIVGSFDNPWKNEADEVDAMAHDRWEPTSDDMSPTVVAPELLVSYRIPSISHNIMMIRTCWQEDAP